jgi:hypothetical protein
MECLDKNSSTWLWGIDAVDISLSLGIRNVLWGYLVLGHPDEHGEGEVPCLFCISLIVVLISLLAACKGAEAVALDADITRATSRLMAASKEAMAG